MAAHSLGSWVRILCLSVVSDVCCQVEVSVSDWPLIHRSPSECGVSECYREFSVMRRPWPTRGCCAIVTKKKKQVKVITGCTK